MTEAKLYAFDQQRLVGIFRERGGEVLFAYADDYTGTPLSLSLPKHGPHASGAAEAYLDNLLPDREEVRERWAREKDLADDRPFTLLSAYGEDVAGALSLTQRADLPTRLPEAAPVATEDDIATRIASLRREATGWVDPRTNPRMSLAGAQGKFTLARVGGRDYWPTYERPSTHILKPPAREHDLIERLERDSLALARQVGIQASHAAVAEFKGEQTFIVERWDRVDRRRLHAEDLNQALGVPTAGKYAVSAERVARLLAEHGQAIAFVRQLAFNVALGNSDAHAKNYSVLLAGEQVRLAPLYDAVPVVLYARYRPHGYAMPIGGGRNVESLSEKGWRQFAANAGLDGDVVCGEAYPIMQAVADRYEDTFADYLDAQRLALLRKHVRVLRRVADTDGRSGASLQPSAASR